MGEKELKSKAFKRAEYNLTKKFNKEFLKSYHHHLMPGYNLNKSPCIDEWNEENVLKLYKNFPFNCDLPKPLLPPAKLSRTVLNKEEPALQLLFHKNRLEDDINKTIKYYIKHKKEFGVISQKNIKWKRKDSESYAEIPKYIAEVAELFEMDPDPYFEGTYNWYYSGGSLSYVQLHGCNVLLFPFMNELVAANIVLIENSIWKPLLQNSSKCRLDGILYETIQNQVNDTYRVLGRQKYQYKLYSLSNPENKIILNEIYSKSSRIPYVSADLSLTNVNQHCTLDAERTLYLWDINRKSHIGSSVLQSKTAHDAWGSIRFQQIDPNVLVYVDRCCLHYIDIRSSFGRPILTLCPKFNLENCESLSVDAASKHNSCRYVGTYHSLLMCDNRSPKQCVRQKWTHQFKNTPLLAATANSEDKEIIILSTQTAGENAIILNTWLSDEDSHSFNLPFTPPYIVETLHEAQMKGMCLNPYLRSRFNLCNAGSALITSLNEKEVFYFVQNSIGDIFYQCITHENVLDKYSPVNTKACYALDMWEKAVSAQSEPLVPLAFTHKCNMQHIYKSFTNQKLRLKPSEPGHENSCGQLSWAQSLAMLESYMDILAPELLAIWEISEEVPEVSISNQPHEKVLSWLETASVNNDVVQSTDEPGDMFTPLNSQELVSVSQEQNVADIDDNNILLEMLLPKVSLKTKRKKRKCN